MAYSTYSCLLLQMETWTLAYHLRELTTQMIDHNISESFCPMRKKKATIQEQPRFWDDKTVILRPKGAITPRIIPHSYQRLQITSGKRELQSTDPDSATQAYHQQNKILRMPPTKSYNTSVISVFLAHNHGPPFQLNSPGSLQHSN